MAETLEPVVPDPDHLRILITAAEAYPEMERAFLAAEREIWAGYRVFDLRTRLRTEEAREVGDTWFDLIVHTLKRGVALHFVLSDFDPILGGELHCASWEARRAFIAAGELAGPEAELHVVNAAHSARVGWLPRLFLWPRLVKEIEKQANELNASSPHARARSLECRPGIRRWLREDANGDLCARKWWPPPLVPGTHHQKMAVFDRKLLCIGGLDLDERRYDDKGHHRRQDETWYDVQLLCRGPIVDDAQRHLETFLETVAARKPAAAPGRLLRTLSRRRRLQLPFLGPLPVVGELADAHGRMIREARDLIYLETQFFRDRRLADDLAEAAETQPSLGLIMILPGAPEDVAFEGATSIDARFGEYLQAECVSRVEQAFGERAAICSPVQPVRTTDDDGRDTLHHAPIIYVHAKVSIFDDDRAIVSSANLNARSLHWDTETGIPIETREDVARLRRRVCGHWLPKPPAPGYFALKEAAGHWRALAAGNAAREPEDRNGFLVPYERRPAQSFGRWLPGMPDAMV